MKLKLKYSTALCALLAVGFQQSAMAAMVDFENETLSPGPISVGSSYVNGSITFTSTEVLQLVGVGVGEAGFVVSNAASNTPGSTPGGVAAQWGEFFLTSDFNNNVR